MRGIKKADHFVSEQEPEGDEAISLNKERLAAQKKAYCQENKDRFAERKRRSYHANRDKELVRQRRADHEQQARGANAIASPGKNGSPKRKQAAAAHQPGR